MLNTIKGIINQKKDFLEAAEIILEDGMGSSLDDLIVLGEEGDVAPEESPVIENDNEPEEPKEDENPKEDDNNQDDDVMDQPVDVDEPASPEPVNDDMTNEPIDDSELAEPVVGGGEENPIPLPGDDSLPEPVSNVTGEPVADDGILSMELDLGSNTPKDVLPVPPNNAGDVISGDEDVTSQRIDSGFGGEETEPINSEPVGAEPTAPVENAEFDSDDMLSEAISLDGGDAGTDTPPAEEAPAEGGTEEPAPVEDTPPAEEEGSSDNAVTAAVKDKVAEADSPAYDGNSDNAKEELMKKLSSITKSLEDAKRAVMSAI